MTGREAEKMALLATRRTSSRNAPPRDTDASTDCAATLASPSSVAPCSGVRSSRASTAADGYRIVALLDAGGMSSVYSAVRVETGTPVAIKVLDPELAMHSFHRERFMVEAALLSRLSHPHVVTFLETGVTDAGEPCLVFERLRGETLRERLNRGPVDLSDIVSVVSQLAGALSAAHEAGIVHRDLKPGNVFLTRVEDGGVHAKLLDFGVSKDATLRPANDEGRMLIGSPGYMAPEQADGQNEIVDARSDQFSLALLAYEMLTGSQPFATGELGSTLNRVKSHDPARPSRLVVGIPPEVDAVIARAMAKTREQRYDDIVDFAREFAAAAKCRPAAGAPASWIRAMLTLCTRRHEGPTLLEGTALDPTLPSAVPPPAVPDARVTR